MTRSGWLVVSMCLCVASCAGSEVSPEADLEGTEGVVTGKADGAATAPTAAEALTRLGALLEHDANLRMPPPARAFHANEMNADVEIVAIADDDALRALVSRKGCEIGHKYSAECATGSFPLFTHPDIHASYTGGWDETTVRTYVANQLVRTAQRAEARRLLAALGTGTWVHLAVYDSGSEIIGDDVIIVAPSGTGKALVFHIDYTQS